MRKCNTCKFDGQRKSNGFCNIIQWSPSRALYDCPGWAAKTEKERDNG